MLVAQRVRSCRVQGGCARPDLPPVGWSVACHELGTALSGFLPASWDHLGCQSWDHPARLAGSSRFRSLTARVMSVDAEVVAGGIQGGQRG